MLSKLAALEHRGESRILNRLERAPADEVQHHADQRLADMLKWSKTRVPHYRRKLARVPDRHIENAPEKVLADLPVLEKADLHNYFDQLTAEGRPGITVRRNATGGSTGETAQFLQDAAYRRWNRAVLARFESWAGWRPGDSKVILWGISRDIEAGKSRFGGLRDRLQRRTMLDAYCMSEKAMTKYAEEIRARRPRLLRVLAQSGVELARFLLDRGFSQPSVGAVVSTGGTLSDNERDMMRKAFGAPVYNVYGSREAGPMAAEAQSGNGLYVCPASHRIEILRPDLTPAQPGERGEVVVTVLINRTMPLLRYRIGDLAEWETTPASRPAWPCIAQVHGRVMDHFIAADGTLVNSEYFTHLMYPMDWIRRFQWVQESPRRVRLCIEPYREIGAVEKVAGVRAGLEADLRAALGKACELEIALVDSISPTASGKYRFTVSHVNTGAAA